MTAQVAMLRRMKLGLCPRDAYDILADRGFDPHPKAEPVEISEVRLAVELADWSSAPVEMTAALLAKSR